MSQQFIKCKRNNTNANNKNFFLNVIINKVNKVCIVPAHYRVGVGLYCMLVLGYPEWKRSTWSTYFKVVKDVEDERMMLMFDLE